MVSLLVITHGEFGAYLVEAAEAIVGPQREGVRSLAISPRHSIEEIRGRVRELVEELDGPDGLVVASDMPGGTPTNVALPLISGRPKVFMVSGVNLYMLVGAFGRRAALPPGELAARMVEDGRRSVNDMRKLLAQQAGAKG
jgi:PTS system mannose-specific IIA component